MYVYLHIILVVYVVKSVLVHVSNIELICAVLHQQFRLKKHYKCQKLKHTRLVMKLNNVGEEHIRKHKRPKLM